MRWISKPLTQVLKGIAIMTVIVQHSNGYDLFTGIPILSNKTITSMCCEMGMGLFLFLSGYGVYKSYVDTGMTHYWENKLRRIFLPFYLMQISLLLYNIIFSKPLPEYRVIIESVGGVYPYFDSSMWYISFQLFLYVVFYILFYLIEKKKAMMILMFVGFLVFKYGPGIWPSGFYCTLSFFVGVIASYGEEECLKRNRTPLKKHINILVKLSVCVFFSVLWHHFYRSTNLLENIFAILAALVVIVVVKSVKEGNALYSLFSFIGSISYVLYLIEMVIIVKPAHRIAEEYTLGKWSWCVWLCFMFFGILIAYFCTLLMKKYIIKST